MLQPGSGDTLQFMKAGILEIPDLLVVHKWDLGAAAERTRADLSLILRSDAAEHAGWEPPIIGASAATGFGVDGLAEAFEELVALHRARWGPGEGGFVSEAYLAFHRRLSKAFAAEDALVLALLEMETCGQKCAGSGDPRTARLPAARCLLTAAC